MFNFQIVGVGLTKKGVGMLTWKSKSKLKSILLLILFY